MKLSDYLIHELGEIIIGDNDNVGFPYLKGAEIVKLYNEFSKEKHIYPDGMREPNEDYMRSRKQYSIDRLKALNETKELKQLLEFVLRKSFFIKNGGVDSYSEIIEKIQAILNDEGIKIEVDINGVARIIGGVVSDDPISVELHFKDIKDQIINKLKDAKVLVWIAMAWFTDDDIMREVLKKQNEGLDVKLIVFDDKINSDYGILKGERKKHYKQLYKIKYDDVRQKMHNKFCVIDMKTVLHGTFNYSLNANRNDETFEVLTDYTKALEFSQEFLRLLKESTNA